MKRTDPNRIAKLALKHEADLTKLGRELAMNFDIPARDIIEMGCCEMGITRREFYAIQSYLCEQDDIAAGIARR